MTKCTWSNGSRGGRSLGEGILLLRVPTGCLPHEGLFQSADVSRSLPFSTDALVLVVFLGGAASSLIRSGPFCGGGYHGHCRVFGFMT